ncbi:hypothetical protein [Streptomyces fulvorobeus]|uniref:Uncharacterized protein n=1 Tax=Streptomyces fulvorobeus TaxID=284028 RepID=A0A7J0C7R0_9ACTN|nr:hypothetical protein [Streptomyces fulvorobeus]NYE41585.1 hypothetical protein [Streptomyces fulvorobeus]GFM97953.1 hypothetical protein Sfulv_27640 [Streptomyces fulvorobeus]
MLTTTKLSSDVTVSKALCLAAIEQLINCRSGLGLRANTEVPPDRVRRPQGTTEQGHVLTAMGVAGVPRGRRPASAFDGPPGRAFEGAV